MVQADASCEVRLSVTNGGAAVLESGARVGKREGREPWPEVCVRARGRTGWVLAGLGRAGLLALAVV